jgi:hypothetical protein
MMCGRDLLQVLLHGATIALGAFGLVGSFGFFILYVLFPFCGGYLAGGIIGAILLLVSILLFAFLYRRGEKVKKTIFRTIEVVFATIFAASLFMTIMIGVHGIGPSSDFYLMLGIAIASLLLGVLIFFFEGHGKRKP